MKYLKLFEDTIYSKGIENRMKTNELKKKLDLLIIEYLNCFDLGVAGTAPQLYPNGTIGFNKNGQNCSIRNTKKNNEIILEWLYNGPLEDELSILIDWFKERDLIDLYNVIATPPDYRKTEKVVIVQTRVKTYMYIKVNQIDVFMNAIRELIDSDEIQLRMNIKKYNI
jgi:hypothetical protein